MPEWRDTVKGLHPRLGYGSRPRRRSYIRVALEAIIEESCGTPFSAVS